MKYLITILACAVAVLYLPVSLGMPYYPMGPYGPSYDEGDDFFSEDYDHGAGSRGGGGFHDQGSNMFYDEGEGHHRTRKVFEDEGHSRHSTGGGRQGSSSGGSYGSSNMYGRGRLDDGSGYSSYGPGMYY